MLYHYIAGIVKRMFLATYLLIEEDLREKHIRQLLYLDLIIIEGISLQFLMKISGKLAKQQRPGGQGWGQESQGIWVVASLPHLLMSLDLVFGIFQWSEKVIKEVSKSK